MAIAQSMVRPAQQSQWREVGAALGQAFVDDPVFEWMVPKRARRARCAERFFGIEAKDIALKHERSMVASDDQGVVGSVLVLPPDQWRLPLRQQALHGPAFVRAFGLGLPRALALLTVMESRHLRRPHYYVAYIGVAPRGQGRGLGTAMLEPVCERADAEGLPTYLEASTPRSARLYARLGFETSEIIRPFGAPPLELMTREPRA